MSQGVCNGYGRCRCFRYLKRIKYAVNHHGWDDRAGGVMDQNQVWLRCARKCFQASPNAFLPGGTARDGRFQLQAFRCFQIEIMGLRANDGLYLMNPWVRSKGLDRAP
jgi:hypothetical protein